MNYSGLNGFLPWRASLMLDVVFLAMFVVLPVLAWSIYQVRYRRRYTLHKNVQLTTGIVLLVAVGFFEIDAQWISPWEERAAASPYFSTNPWDSTVHRLLWVHLCFAVTTPLLWIWVIVRAFRRFPKPPTPGEHSRSHLFWGRLAALDMVATAVTGWIFYWVAFVA